MKVLIIEDEQPTALRLKKLLTEIDPGIEVLDILDSVATCIKWYDENLHPDLVFQDIHLADGSSFEIFEQITVRTPVIFITAYDQYALQAFKVNSISYLLKPVRKSDLADALNKFREFRPQSGLPDYASLMWEMKNNGFPKRFVVRYGQKIKAVEVADIAYFFTESGNSFFKTFDNHLYPLDHSLDKLDAMLDPALFYRINRQVIIHFKAIREMYSWSKSRVRIILDPPSEFETIASTDRSGDFKQWLTGKR